MDSFILLTADDLPMGGRRLAPWLGLAGLGALWLAARAMAVRTLPPAMLACLVLGILLWVVVAAIDPPAADRLGALDPPASRPRIAALLLSLLAAAICWWRMPPDEFRQDGVAAWAAAIVLWFVAWWPGRGSSRPSESTESRAHRGLVVAALVVLLGIEAWFLFHDLRGVPANPISDHAEEMLDMRDLIEGRDAIFFTRNLGNGPLHFYWTAFLVKGLGLPLRYQTLKMATALFGLLVVPAFYLLGAEMGGAPVGLAAAAFGAWGKWPVSLARQGIEYIYPTPLTAIALWALLRYLRRGDRGSVLAAGAALGVGMHTYLSFRIVPLLVPLAIAAALVDRRRRGRRWSVIGDGVLIAATSVILFLPVLKFALFGTHNEFFWSRIASRATAAERPLDEAPLRVFAGNLVNIAKAFHWQGSSTWTVLIPGEPFLDTVAAALLIAGVVLAVRLVLARSWRWAAVFVALFVLTLPSTLAIAYPNENPSLNRAGTAIPVIFLLVGLAYAYLARGLWRERPPLRAAGAAVLATGAIVSARLNARAYFEELGPAYSAIIEHAIEIADVIRRNVADGIPIGRQYLLAVDYWVDGRNIALDLGDPTWADTNIIPSPKVPDLTARPLAFIYRSSDTERLATLQRLYPGGTNRLVPQSHRDRNFSLYVVR
ncbi:MAG TPA: glycosyltransferase family 39 protein [Thermoanaerobaculia bacterium]|nr:glycosyltransferase family 39 protein [Thermoanaerobaculia bacterium]